MDRNKMIKKLIQNEIDWLVGDPTFENVESIVEFFTNGGFNNLPDNEIKTKYEGLIAWRDQ